MSSFSELPKEIVHQLTIPLNRFIRMEAFAAIFLLVFSIAAMILSNSAWSESFLAIWKLPIGIHVGSFNVSYPARYWINEGLMTFFFFLIALELKRELIFGELRNFRIAVLSVVAAFGGMLIPIIIYLIILSGEQGQNGWGTVMSTDTAFLVGCLALLGKRISHSLRLFMLSIAIVDDIGAIIMVAIISTQSVNWLFLGLSLIGFITIYLMGKLGIRNLAVYFFVGVLIWFAINASGFQATITGVILGLMTPTTTWVSDQRLHAILERVVAYPKGDHWSGDTEDRKALRMAETAAREAVSPLERLEMMLHPWIGCFIMPLFALANAGITIKFSDFKSWITAATFLGLAFGKPIGILSFSWLAISTGIAKRPQELSWRLMIGGSVLAGIGFTMSLFIAELSFNPELINHAKVGIFLASIFCALIGIFLLSFKRI